MHSGNMKEQFNIAYVCAMAAQAGLNHNNPVVDDDSVDLTLSGKGYVGKVRNPHIDLQLKCSSQNLISGNVIKFSLSKKNYDDLRLDDYVHPRYLVVLLVPPDNVNWIQHHDTHMSLHERCYWVSIKGHPESDNDTKVTVDVPLSQRLTTEQLLTLMQQASDGAS
jgi:hypothetical protein